MKLVVNILDNELWSSKARINFSKKIGHVVKVMFVFLNIVLYLSITHEYSHILPESFFEPTTIYRTHFFVQKFNFVIEDGRIQLSNIQANETLV